MGFAWNNFSKGIAKKLARAAGLRVTHSFADLADKYGEPPTQKVVQEIWGALLECWLALRKDARIAVIEKLRELEQGDLTIKIRTRTGQMAYLRSCPESPLLDEVVLERLQIEGSQHMYAASVVVDAECSDTQAEINYANLFYIDESELQTKTEDEEWQDSYDMGDRPADYPEPAKTEFEDFMKRMGYTR